MKRIMCLTLVLAFCLGIGSFSYASADQAAKYVTDEMPIKRKPVTITKTGVAACNVSNEFIQGTFYVNYTVKYTVSGGVYTVNSCVAEYDYFTGVIRGDLYQPSASYSWSASGTLSIQVAYQVKYEQNGLTYYTPRGYASTTVSLIN